jgi:hypothetical protein
MTHGQLLAFAPLTDHMNPLMDDICTNCRHKVQAYLAIMPTTPCTMPASSG